MKYFLPLFFGLLFVPLIACADVKINEVAWMGTDKSQYSEWIELYNTGDSAVSLAGWKLYVTGSELLYTLTKSIAAHGYLLVERTTASAPDAVPGINDETGSFGAGGLSNTGENLILKNSTGTTVDTLSYSSGWPAGDTDTHDTMQWNGQKWITAPGTPDAPNAAQGVTPPPSATSSSSSGGTSTSSSGSTSSGTTANGSNTTNTKTSTTSTKTVTTKSKITVTASKSIFQGVRNEFDATIDLPDTLKTPQGYYYWNMGDGTTYMQSVLTPIGYTYHYPGTYTISVSYFSSPNASQPYLQSTTSAVVTAPLATLQILNGGAALQITNNGTKAMDIGQWPISTALGIRALPPLTTIAAKAHIIVTAQTLGLSTIQNPVLRTPDGSLVVSKK